MCRSGPGEYIRRYPVERIFLDWHYTLGRDISAIDLDLMEYCHECKDILALFEYATGGGQEAKATSVLCSLARRAVLPAYLVYWHRDKENYGISKIVLKQVWPDEERPCTLSLTEFGEWLTNLHRVEHQCVTLFDQDAAS